MGMRPVLMRIFDLVIIRVVHSVIKLFLCQAFGFSLFGFTPVLMTGFMTKIILPLDWLMCVGVKELSLFVLFCSALDFFSNFLADIWAMECHN